MLIEEWFQTLRSKAETVEQKWQQATESEKLQLADQLIELRKLSDQVVDQWLQFEEKLSAVIRQIKLAEGQSVKQEKVPENVTSDEKLGVYHHMFRKGEGFYHLRLYQDAKLCFADLLKESPDWESGRLYYAYSLLFCDEKEAAMREFRLLSMSASSPKVVGISYNAIGCILAEEEQWLEAAQAFKTALKIHPAQRDAQFNLALCLLKDGEAQEALEEIEEVLRHAENDWEAQLVWLRAAKLLQVLDETAEPEPPASLQLPNRKLDTETLREMASLYESLGNYHRAQICYHFLAERLPREGWVWHGLAWNTWLIAGTKRALTLVRKAISLVPDNLDFHFSFGWMKLFDGRTDEAINVFRFILLKERDHRLAQSGLIAAYERTGDLLTAKRMAQHFTEETSSYIRSLGFYHLGRIAVTEQNWRLAEQYFRRALQHSDEFREIPLYLQLCAAKLGQAFEAREPFVLHP
ncbi:tetratricopeptide repeat protein [Brevibacillus sp. H7]|uniref:tetratricopeptide repeat protein n=1 Tax=Brevibacillus sp. H7 TaxID=3349138 RepID=UPI0038288091